MCFQNQLCLKRGSMLGKQWGYGVRKGCQLRIFLQHNDNSPLPNRVGWWGGHALDSISHCRCTWCGYVQVPNGLHALTAKGLKAASKVNRQGIGQFRLYAYSNHGSNLFGGQEPGTPQCKPSGGENSVDLDNTGSDRLIWIAGSRAWEEVSRHGARFKHLIKNSDDHAAPACNSVTQLVFLE